MAAMSLGLGMGSAWAGDFGFAFDGVEQQFKKAQELVKIDLGLSKVKCNGDGKSQACTYKTSTGAVVIFGTKGSRAETIIALFEKPGLKAGFEFFAVSAWAVALGDGVSDAKAYRAQYDAAVESYLKQAKAGELKIEVVVGNYQWTMFRVNPQKDEMFVKVLN